MNAQPPPEPPENIPLPPNMGKAPVPPALLPIQAGERWKGVYWPPSTYLRGHLFIHALAFLVLAYSLAFQPERYTPENLQGLHFLVRWLPPQGWAIVFGLVGLAKLVCGFAYPHWSRQAILGGILLLTMWTIGFGFAWLWGHATAIGFVGYGLVLGEHFAAMTMLDGRKHWGAPTG